MSSVPNTDALPIPSSRANIRREMSPHPRSRYLEPTMRIQVEQRAGHCGVPVPWRLHLGRRQIDVLEALDQWHGPDYRYIKVRGHDGALYILRFDEPHAEWALTMFRSSRAQMRTA
jgi:hypothetical protein